MKLKVAGLWSSQLFRKRHSETIGMLGLFKAHVMEMQKDDDESMESDVARKAIY